MTGMVTPPAAATAFMAHAACRDMDPALFVPGPGRNGHNYAQARKVCADCPVRIDCLEFALTVGERHGMWGGLTPAERRPYLRHRRVPGRNATVIAFPARPTVTPGATS